MANKKVKREMQGSEPMKTRALTWNRRLRTALISLACLLAFFTVAVPLLNLAAAHFHNRHDYVARTQCDVLLRYGHTSAMVAASFLAGILLLAVITGHSKLASPYAILFGLWLTVWYFLLPAFAVALE